MNNDTIRVYVIRGDGTEEIAEVPISYPRPGACQVDLTSLKLTINDRFRLRGADEWGAGTIPIPPKLGHLGDE